MILYGYLASEYRAMRGNGTVHGLPPARSDLQMCRTSSQAVEAFRVRRQRGDDSRLNAESACLFQDVSVLVLCIVALVIFSAIAISGQF